MIIENAVSEIPDTWLLTMYILDQIEINIPTKFEKKNDILKDHNLDLASLKKKLL